jgi:hypothetical protein
MLLLLPAFLAGCKSHPLTDYRPLDHAGMWSSSMQDLKKLNVNDAEVAQLVSLKNAGVSDDMCISLVQAARAHQHPFASAASAASLNRAGFSEEQILVIARNDQLDSLSGDAVMLRLIGLADPTVQLILQRRMKGLTTMSSAEIGRLKNTGLSEREIVSPHPKRNDRRPGRRRSRRARKSAGPFRHRLRSGPRASALSSRPALRLAKTALGRALCTPVMRRYNELVTRVPPQPVSVVALGLVVLLTACCGAGCATPFGPGYVVKQQEIRVSFLTHPQPLLLISAQYRLENTGNQALDSLDVRLPGGRYRSASFAFSWDAAPLSHRVSPDNPRDTELRFDQLWKIGETHDLKISYELAPPTGDDVVSFSEDAFYLPSLGWTPQLPQARGLFGFGGVPPKQWPLVAVLPPDFLVHASGEGPKRSGKGSAVQYSFRQTSADLTPFLIAGKYVETRQTLGESQTIYVWTRGKLDAAELRNSGQALSETLATYDRLFGARPKSRSSLWIGRVSSARRLHLAARNRLRGSPLWERSRTLGPTDFRGLGSGRSAGRCRHHGNFGWPGFCRRLAGLWAESGFLRTAAAGVRPAGLRCRARARGDIRRHSPFWNRRARPCRRTRSGSGRFECRTRCHSRQKPAAPLRASR